MTQLNDLLNRLKQEQFQHDLIVNPEFYRILDSKQRESFEQLLSAPGIIVCDFLFDQIKELIKIKSPQKKFTDDELIKEVNKHIEPLSIEEYGVWVYYPWSNRLVHVPDEDEFIEIRTNRNQYKITKEERAILSKKAIGVVGLSVGQSVALTLAMERICSEIRLADFDILELTNFNRIRTGIHNLGIYKVNAVAREIAEIDPFIKVTCFLEGLLESNMDSFFLDGGKLDLLIEESDGFEIKILSRYKARELGVPVIMETSDRCMVDVERFDLEPNRSVLHGLVDHLDLDTLRNLKTNEEKFPYILDILGLETSSLRIKASMLEIEQSINTWPQLASSVAMGGGITADVSRRILLKQYSDSGRYHIDIEELIGDKKPQMEPYVWVDPYEYTDVEAITKKYNVQFEDNQAILSDSEVSQIINAAIQAPSGGNYQPWKWALKNNTLLGFYALEGEAVFLGYGNISACLAIGSAIENAVLKAKQLHLDAKVEVFPDKNIKQLVAQVKFYPEKSLDPKLINLAEAIETRHTNRSIVKRPIIETEKLKELIDLTNEMEGANLQFFTSDRELFNIGEILGELEILRLLEKGGQSDFSDEMRWTEEENNKRRDGVDIRTVELTNPEKAGLTIAQDGRVIELINEWNGGGAFSKLTKKMIDSAGAVGILSMNGQTLTDYFNGGRIIEKIWLKANIIGLAFQPITASLFVYNRLIHGKGANISEAGQKKLWDLRPKFEEVFNLKSGNGDIMIFRLTKADIPEIKSLRRPLEAAFYKCDID